MPRADAAGVRVGALVRLAFSGPKAAPRVLETLLDPSGPYVSTSPRHEGLLLHSIYHRPGGWDHVPSGSRIPRGESSMWGDYHAREAALYVLRLCSGQYLTFFGAERVKVSA